MTIGETKLRILTAALTPSRYTDLARSSGVSKTMFDRHLDDLIEDGLIEKTEEGLYVITTKGIELLLKLKADEQQNLVEKIKGSLLPRKKKVPEEVKHNWFEIGRLYAEYLLKIKELTMVQTDFSKLVDKEERAAFITDLENLVNTSYSLSIYIIGRLRDYGGRFLPPLADILKRMLTLEADTLFVVPPSFIQYTLSKAEEKLDLILNEVRRLAMISDGDIELKLAVSYLEIRLEDLKTYIIRARKRLKSEALGS